MLPDDATDAGLLGVSFFGGRGLSMPFSGGEWAGLARGVAGSWKTDPMDFMTRVKCTLLGLITADVNRMFAAAFWPQLTSLDTSTTRSSLFSPSLSCEKI